VKKLLATYDVTAHCNPNEIQLSGPLNVERFTKYASLKKAAASVQSRVKKYSENFGHLYMLFDGKTLNLKEYSLGTSDKPKKFVVKFSSFRANQDLSENVFMYNPPKGVQAQDITKDLTKQFEEK
jgi:hypothetical protein